MACLYVDSCTSYASSSDAISAGWINTNSISTGGGRWGAGALVFGSIYRDIGSNLTTGACGFVTDNSGSSLGTSNDIFSLQESGSSHLTLGYVSSSDGRLELRGAGVVLGTTTTSVAYSFSSIQFAVEVKWDINDTTGSCEVWINGVKEIDVSNVDTRNGGSGYVNRLYWSMPVSGTITVSEVYINDLTGSAPNNNVWAAAGGYRIDARRPSVAGNYAQWTPLSSTNVSNVDETRNDGDTSYNSSSTAGQKDTFQFTAIPSTSGTIPAIMHQVVARKDDANNRTIRPIQRQTSDYNGTTVTVSSTSYLRFREVVETNPATSSAYTVSEMRATSPEFGYELVS